MKKQNVLWCFVTAFLLACIFSSVLADTTLSKNDNNAESILALDMQSNQILFAQKSDEVRPLASITKLVSALVLLDLPIKWNSYAKITDADCDAFSRQVIAGEILSLEDLWNIALVGSVNSAMKALVRHSGVDRETFVVLMNKKAKSLKLDSLVLVEPSGLNSKNVGNAKDVARLLKEALKSKKIFNALQTGVYFAKPLHKETSRKIYNTNWLLTGWIPHDFPPGSIVGKTGFLKNIGYNLTVRMADNKNRQIIIVVLGSKSFTSRFAKARELATQIFNNDLGRKS